MVKAPVSKTDDESHAGSIPVSSADDKEGLISPLVDEILAFMLGILVAWAMIRCFVL